MCVKDVGTFLFEKHVPMRSECVKIVVCQESHHMILIPTPSITACVGMYEFIPHVLAPFSNMCLHFWVISSFVIKSSTPRKKNGDYTSCCIHGFDDQMHLWVFVCAICKCAYVKCECADHNRGAKVCEDEYESMSTNFLWGWKHVDMWNANAK